MQPTERIYSTGFTIKAAELSSMLSYRKSTDVINSFSNRDSEITVKHRTLADYMERIGNSIADTLKKDTNQVLEIYGFDYETGLPGKDIELTENITGVSENKANTDMETIDKVISEINAEREEKIPFSANDLEIEESCDNCVYISIDEIGVKEQKQIRKTDYKKEKVYVENTVVHIKYGQKNYMLTALNMSEAVKSTIAFMLYNSLFKYRLVFFSDGAKNIKNTIEKLFSFHSHTIILDWYHLKKKCMEFLSMALKGKDKRNEVLEKLLRFLWVGDTVCATNFLKNLQKSYIKNEQQLSNLISYIDRKSENIACYALRAKLNLPNSSNPVEKANDILVAQRQKHNGMAWSESGSGSLAAINMIFKNGEADNWFYHNRLSFHFPETPALSRSA